MIAYFDTSALVKAFIEEEGSDLVRSWLMESAQVICSQIGLVESHSAFVRRRAAGFLSDVACASAAARFYTAWAGIVAIDLDVQAAAAAATTYALRGMDAIHLSAAQAVSEAIAPLSVTMVTFDRELAAAARASGLNVLP